MIDEYIATISALIAATDFLERQDVHFDRRSDEIVFIRGNLIFTDGSHLHFREFARQPQGQLVERYTYAYHYQRADGFFVFRDDDAPHFRNLPKFPHHKHSVSETNVTETDPPDLAAVLHEIENLIQVK
jgi:hypothetical protein